MSSRCASVRFLGGACRRSPDFVTSQSYEAMMRNWRGSSGPILIKSRRAGPWITSPFSVSMDKASRESLPSNSQYFLAQSSASSRLFAVWIRLSLSDDHISIMRHASRHPDPLLRVERCKQIIPVGLPEWLWPVTPPHPAELVALLVEYWLTLHESLRFQPES